MKILFYDTMSIDYNVDTPLQKPLGGIQSAICYLTTELAQRGYEITLLNHTSEPGSYRNVCCGNVFRTPVRLDDFDIIVSTDTRGSNLRQFGWKRPLVLWTGQDIDQLNIQHLHEEKDCWDRYVFVSNWQAERYLSCFRIDPNKISLISNAIAPVFEETNRSSYFFDENRPPILFYSSTPYRGLDVLIRAFPRIRSMVPGAVCKIFSSMKVYQSDDTAYQNMFELCRTTEGMEYLGSVDQLHLCAESIKADIFAYPSTYHETSCISLMEAMASGCLVVSHRLGALPETAGGYGYFLEMESNKNLDSLANNYAEFVVDKIKSAYQEKNEMRTQLDAQQTFAKHFYRYSYIADRWEELLRLMYSGR